MASTEINTQDIEHAVSLIIRRTFEKLYYIYNNHKEGNIDNDGVISGEMSRLIFPCYGEHRKYEVRVSEQELRFAFVESFYEYCSKKEHLDLFYSIETPTKHKFSFKEKDNPHKCVNGDVDYDSAQSALFDLVIYDNKMKRLAYFEFKANNATKEKHKKDICKLIENPHRDDNSLCYFIEIVKSHNDRTKSSLDQKLELSNNLNEKVKCIVFDISSNDIIMGEEKL